MTVHGFAAGLLVSVQAIAIIVALVLGIANQYQRTGVRRSEWVYFSLYVSVCLFFLWAGVRVLLGK